MGALRSASWMAVGYAQRLDTAGAWQWSGYLGHGRSADPSHASPLHRPAILVIDQLLTRRLDAHWQVGLGASFRSQWRYAAQEPFGLLDPVRDEERFHARIVLKLPVRGWRIQMAAKEEFRRFCTPDLLPWGQDIEWRSRFKVQAEHALGHGSRRKVVLSAEELFATDHQRGGADHWSPMTYRESRIAAYLVQGLDHGRIDLSVGGMADLLREGTPRVGPYIVTSLSWRDPFHGHAHRS